jgi:hypothetical protein
MRAGRAAEDEQVSVLRVYISWGLRVIRDVIHRDRQLIGPKGHVGYEMRC